jgi:hypothetical protein
MTIDELKKNVDFPYGDRDFKDAHKALTKFENMIEDQKFVLNEHLILELEECFYEFEHIYTNYLLPLKQAED